jgi:hypothetical protein
MEKKFVSYDEISWDPNEEDKVVKEWKSKTNFSPEKQEVYLKRWRNREIALVVDQDEKKGVIG